MRKKLFKEFFVNSMNRFGVDVARGYANTRFASQLSRRGVLRGAAAGTALAGLGALLTACGGSTRYVGDGSGGHVRWGNWTYYLDYDKDTKRYPTLDAFMKKTNINVDYFEDIDDNKTFYAKIKDQLQLGKDTGYDTFCFSDVQSVRLVEKDELQAFDHSKLPSVRPGFIDLVKHARFDLEREYTVPYQCGMAGICYNTEAYPQGVRQISDLWNSDLKGKVSLLTDASDTVGLIMLQQGVDVAGDEWGDTEYFNALDVVKKYLADGQVATVKGNSYVQDMQAGRVLAGMCWSGDVASMNDEAGGEKWKFVVPEAGGTLFIDSFCMPKKTDAVGQVHELIEYYYQPEVAAQVAEYVQYVTPVRGAQEAMRKVNPELADNKLIFPDEQMYENLYNMRIFTAQEDNRYQRAFQKTLGN